MCVLLFAFMILKHGIFFAGADLLFYLVYDFDAGTLNSNLSDAVGSVRVIGRLTETKIILVSDDVTVVLALLLFWL